MRHLAASTDAAPFRPKPQCSRSMKLIKTMIPRQLSTLMGEQTFDRSIALSASFWLFAESAVSGFNTRTPTFSPSLALFQVFAVEGELRRRHALPDLADG